MSPIQKAGAGPLGPAKRPTEASEPAGLDGPAAVGANPPSVEGPGILASADRFLPAAKPPDPRARALAGSPARPQRPLRGTDTALRPLEKFKTELDGTRKTRAAGRKKRVEAASDALSDEPSGQQGARIQGARCRTRAAPAHPSRDRAGSRPAGSLTDPAACPFGGRGDRCRPRGPRSRAGRGRGRGRSRGGRGHACGCTGPRGRARAVRRNGGAGRRRDGRRRAVGRGRGGRRDGVSRRHRSRSGRRCGVPVRGGGAPAAVQVAGASSCG